MENLLRNAVQQKRQFLIEELIKSGVYKKNNKHLYEWTLTDLENEFHFVEANGYVSKSAKKMQPSKQQVKSN